MKQKIGICLILSILIALSACSHAWPGNSGQEKTITEAAESTAAPEKDFYVETEDTDTAETVLETETTENGKDKLLYMGQASMMAIPNQSAYRKNADSAISGPQRTWMFL